MQYTYLFSNATVIESSCTSFTNACIEKKRYNCGLLTDNLKNNFKPIQCLPLTGIDETENLSMLSSLPF